MLSARANQGAFRFDGARSGFYPARMKAFPDNTEIETIVTFAPDQPGSLVSNVTPDPQSFTLRIHHSLLRAPVGYTPRPADPRIGVSSLEGPDDTPQAVVMRGDEALYRAKHSGRNKVASAAA